VVYVLAGSISLPLRTRALRPMPHRTSSSTPEGRAASAPQTAGSATRHFCGAPLSLGAAHGWGRRLRSRGPWFSVPACRLLVGLPMPPAVPAGQICPPEPQNRPRTRRKPVFGYMCPKEPMHASYGALRGFGQGSDISLPHGAREYGAPSTIRGMPGRRGGIQTDMVYRRDVATELASGSMRAGAVARKGGLGGCA
jgi:hypothetical protein